MRKFIQPAAIAIFSFMIIASCSKEKQESATQEVSSEALAKIASLGFSTLDVQRTDGGYLVEGDILLSEKKFK